MKNSLSKVILTIGMGIVGIFFASCSDENSEIETVSELEGTKKCKKGYYSKRGSDRVSRCYKLANIAQHRKDAEARKKKRANERQERKKNRR